MDEAETRARDLAEEMREWVGATVVQGSVILIGPGAPITAQFTMYQEADLQKAFSLGLLHRRQVKIHDARKTDTIDILAYGG